MSITTKTEGQVLLKHHLQSIKCDQIHNYVTRPAKMEHVGTQNLITFLNFYDS